MTAPGPIARLSLSSSSNNSSKQSKVRLEPYDSQLESDSSRFKLILWQQQYKLSARQSSVSKTVQASSNQQPIIEEVQQAP